MHSVKTIVVFAVGALLSSGALAAGEPSLPQPIGMPAPHTRLPDQKLPAPNLRPVKPDLVIVSVAPGAGAQRPAMITVRNAGDGSTGTAAGIKLSCQPIVGGRDSGNCQRGTVLGAVGPLAPGAQTVVTLTLATLGKGGQPLRSATLHACLDSDHRVAESNESNNCATGRW